MFLVSEEDRSALLSLLNLITVDDKAKTALTTVVTLLLALSSHGGHEDARTANVLGAVTTKASDLAALLVNLVVLQGREFHLFVLVGSLLGGFVDFFLALLATTTEAEDEVEGRL